MPTLSTEVVGLDFLLSATFQSSGHRTVDFSSRSAACTSPEAPWRPITAMTSSPSRCSSTSSRCVRRPSSPAHHDASFDRVPPDRQKVTHGVFAHSFEEKPVRLPPEIRDRRAMRRRLHLPQPVSDLPLTSPIHI